MFSVCIRMETSNILTSCKGSHLISFELYIISYDGVIAWCFYILHVGVLNMKKYMIQRSDIALIKRCDFICKAFLAHPSFHDLDNCQGAQHKENHLRNILLSVEWKMRTSRTHVAAQYTRILLHIHAYSATLLGLSQKSVRSIRQENWLQSWQSGTMKSQDSVLSANSNKSKNVWSNLRVPHLPWKLPTFAVCQSIQSNRKKHTGGCTSSTKNVQNSCYKNSCKIPKSPPLQQ